MVHLLTPDEVKKGPSQAVEELQGRVRDLSNEETRLVNSINFMREEEREALSKKAERDEVSQSRPGAKKVILENEVEILEARKNEALIPVRVIEEHVNQRAKENETNALQLSQREIRLKTAEEKNVETAERLHDKQQDLDEREEKIQHGESGIVAAKDEVKKSAAALGKKWAAYHEAIATTNEEAAKRNEELEKREKVVEAGEKANEIAKEENEKRALEYKEKDKEIADRYATLERATTEILGKKSQ